MRWFTCEKKIKTHKNLMNMKPRRIGVRNLLLNHFWTTCSLFSKDIRENFFGYGHSSPRLKDPHSKKVPILLQRILTTSLTTNAPSENPLFITISATCRHMKYNVQNTISTIRSITNFKKLSYFSFSPLREQDFPSQKL